MKKQALLVILILFAAIGVLAQTSQANLAALKKAAESGDPKAQCELGVLYFNGEGVAKNIPEAIRLFTLSAEKKYLDSQTSLGWIFRHSPGYLDPAKSAKYYLAAAQQGDAESQYVIALMYKAGEGLAKNEKEAAAWLLKASGQKHPEAQSALGDCYEKGLGVKKDKVEALKWYFLAKVNGDSLADMFIDGIKPGMSASQIAEARKRADAVQK
jgi:TPR repeat protein